MNEEILTYNTPTSEYILKQINHYDFKRLWESNLKKNNKNLFWGTIFIVAGIIAVLLKDYAFSGFFLGFAVASFSYYLNYKSEYKKSKKDFQSRLDREILNIKMSSKDVTWEFTSSHFSFKNYKSEYKFIWQEITYCILDDKYLYITASSFMNFILDKGNIDEDNLNKTIQYLEDHSFFKKI